MKIIVFYGQLPASFCLLSLFSNNFTEQKTVDSFRIRTWIVRVENKHVDQLTTTLA